MNRESIKSYFLNAGCILALSILYCITGGLVQFLAGILASVLIGTSVTKHHYAFVSIECLLCLAVVSGFYGIQAGVMGIIAGLSSGVILVLIGIGLGLSTNLKLSVSGTVLLCSAIYLANMLIGFMLIGREMPFDILLSEFRDILSETFKAQYSSMPDIGMQLDAVIDEMMALTFKFMPSFLICSALISGFIATLIYSKTVVKLNKNVKPVSFSFLRVERTVGVLCIVILLIAAFSEDALISDAVLNVVVIMSFIFFICGLSYFDFSMKKKGKNRTYRSIMIIVVIPLVSMLFLLPSAVICGAGFLDSLINFRKNKISREDENGNQ